MDNHTGSHNTHDDESASVLVSREEHLAPSPWYRDRNSAHPFSLVAKICSNDPQPDTFRAVASFPWDKDSLETLWGGSMDSAEIREGWTRVQQRWYGATAAGGGRTLHITFPFPSRQRSRKRLCVRLPDEDANITCIEWAINRTSPLEPLVVFGSSRLLYILNVEAGIICGCLRGHGGDITSIAVHPTHPYLFCTTARDFTSRIYDLSQSPLQEPNNPVWPPNSARNLAGAPHGLHMTEAEGTGIGRCVAVLCGGRSGGHQAAVLAAAFHPSLPVIATSGLDRTVKIWRTPTLDGETLGREDKPLFSSSWIHKARVLTITWLSEDILLSHCAPALMRSDINDSDSDLFEEKGTLVMWRWLGVDRFFPPNPDHIYGKYLRGCASDYQESASFKLISINPLPLSTRHLHVYRSARHDPLVLFPISNTIRILNTAHLPVHKPPLLQDDLDEITKQLRLSEVDVLDELGWEIQTDVGEVVNPECEMVEACEMTRHGKVIVGVGARGTIWVWRMRCY